MSRCTRAAVLLLVVAISAEAAARQLAQAAPGFIQASIPPSAAPTTAAPTTSLASTPTAATGPVSGTGNAQQDLTTIAGGAISAGNPTIPKSYTPTPAGKSPFDTCGCGLEYAPVCANDTQTYGNACIAKCINQAVVSQGSCKPCSNTAKGSCQCGSEPFAQVCAEGITFDTACDAECNGKNCYTPGPCLYTIAANSSFIPSTGSSPAGTVAAASSNTQLPAATSTPSKDYGDALTKALLFYESQRSGTLPTRYLAWRGDSCSGCLGPGGEQLQGGFYEAGGSFLKLGLPSAYTVTNLAWGAAAFAAGYQRTNTTGHVNDLIKWGADFLVASWNSSAQGLVAVMGNNSQDFNYYGAVEEYEAYVARPAFYINAQAPGSEVAGEAAAALAAAHLSGASPGDDYLTTAEQLYQFGTGPALGSYQNTSSPGIQILAALYPSTGYTDELAWGAAWLYKATNTSSYLTDARNYYQQCCSGYAGYTYEVGLKEPALHILMAEIDPQNAGTYNQNAQSFFDQYLKQSIPHTNLGLAYPYHWGALRPAQSAAFLALQYSQQIRSSNPSYSARLFNYAQFQVDYALGDGGRSWVSGVGTDYPQYVWHKTSYASLINWDARGKFQWMNRATGPWTSPLPPAVVDPVITMYTKFEMEGNTKPQPFIPYGALFAAPARDDSLCSSRRDYTYAEPTTEGQGGFTGAVAGLAAYYTGTAPINLCSLDLGFSHPNATVDATAIVSILGCSTKSQTTG